MYELVYGSLDFTQVVYVENCQIVIVRAFGDEPCRLNACSAGGEDVVVFRESLKDAIPYPRAFVYEWDDELFNELHSAFHRGMTAELASLWARARFYIPSRSAH